MKLSLKRIAATLDQLGAYISAANICPIDYSDYATSHVGLSRLGLRSAMSSTQPAKMKSSSIEPFPLPNPLGGALSTTPGTSGMSPKPSKKQSQDQSASQRHQAQRIAPTDAMASGGASLTGQPGTMMSPGKPGKGHPTPDPSQRAGLEMGEPRYAANPNLAIGLLKQVETLVQGWQAELEQIAQQIRAIYDDGPIVDGWLESYPADAQPAQAASVSVLRYAEIDHLMKLVEQICATQPTSMSEDMCRTQYRLCGLDPDGKLWSRPCPSQQVPYVSLAIARYQKLRTLFAKKQSIDARLMNLVESLTRLHGQIGHH
ncbi:hypothetical protein [Thermocoleostomius sinensis]|uniref:Uncharacterized protein n=1 Tax=Thermocoleostomius sinensis A174 TaxID=2016057 RepID=A0A9E8ZK48_9CYAN|nr:hypothetical protein [Thermocoleostomius sinensis]WAL62685.1 hypothetical protein OXH18_12040 [Thermocoleostomius sinensis A174]